MTPRPADERRVLGLWTAGCLAVLLTAGITWLGDWSVQWPVLLVPLAWALVALRPRRGERRRRTYVAPSSRDTSAPGDRDDPHRRPPVARTDTVERPWIRDERYRP